jgi:hypothetical protein
MREFRLLILLLGIASFGVTAGCAESGGGGEGDHCHDDDECSGDLHCHIEAGEDEGVCEAEEAT